MYTDRHHSQWIGGNLHFQTEVTLHLSHPQKFLLFSFHHRCYRCKSTLNDYVSVIIPVYGIWCLSFRSHENEIQVATGVKMQHRSKICPLLWEACIIIPSSRDSRGILFQLPARRRGTHCQRTFVVWRTAPLHLDDHLRLICFLSTSVYSALRVSAIMRYINRRFTYLLTYNPHELCNICFQTRRNYALLDHIPT